MHPKQNAVMDEPCPYCGGTVLLTDSAEVYGGRSYGMIWICRPCHAYVGVHRNSKKCRPLGRLANAELRKGKKAAHRAFDPLWKQRYRRAKAAGRYKKQVVIRGQAYKWLAEQLGIPLNECHIGMFNAEQCQQVVDVCKLGGKNFIEGELGGN